MDYATARDSIETGDAILVTKAHNVMGRLTQFFTRSTYTHVGVAVWISGRLYMAELNGGRNHLVPVSQLAEFDVYQRPRELDQSAVLDAIFTWLAQPVDYGLGAFVAIGLLNWFRIKIFVHWRKCLVCSGYVVAIYETAGWPERSRVISPQELSEQLVWRLPVRLT